MKWLLIIAAILNYLSIRALNSALVEYITLRREVMVNTFALLALVCLLAGLALGY